MHHPSIQWLFFDLGSTLIDEREVYAQIFRTIAQHAHQPCEAIHAEALRFYRQGKKGDLELRAKYRVPASPWDHSRERLYADAENTLRCLHARYKLGVIANQSAGTAERLRSFGILHHFDLLLSSAEEGVAKPDPAIFARALQRANCPAPCAVMIGDRLDNDILPAKRAGMRTVRILQGFGALQAAPSPEAQPDFTIHQLSELCDLF